MAGKRGDGGDKGQEGGSGRYHLAITSFTKVHLSQLARQVEKKVVWQWTAAADRPLSSFNDSGKRKGKKGGYI